MILPLVDMINHSQDPNCVILPYHDKISDTSHVVIKAVKDIEPGEQICVSYGALSNSHLV